MLPGHFFGQNQAGFPMPTSSSAIALEAEELLWEPELQEVKYSETGGRNVRYKRSIKGSLVKQLQDMVHEKLPYCKIRYAF